MILVHQISVPLNCEHLISFRLWFTKSSTVAQRAVPSWPRVLSVWSLQILHVTAWVSPGFFGCFLHPKEVQVDLLISHCKLPWSVGVDDSGGSWQEHRENKNGIKVHWCKWMSQLRVSSGEWSWISTEPYTCIYNKLIPFFSLGGRKALFPWCFPEWLWQ